MAHERLSPDELACMAQTTRLFTDGTNIEVANRARIAWAVAIHFRFCPDLTSGFRTLAEQAVLRRRWELGLSRFPANRPGESSHNFGAAFDSVVEPQFQALWTRIRQAVGFRVPRNDVIHAEAPGWRLLQTGPPPP